jgi:hypothetical protein
MSMPSHPDNGTAKSCWQWCYRGDVGRDTMSMPSHDGDSVVESCWRWCYKGDLAAARCQVMSVRALQSHVDDSAVEVTWPQHDVDVKSCQ